MKTGCSAATPCAAGNHDSKTRKTSRFCDMDCRNKAHKRFGWGDQARLDKKEWV